MAVDAVRMNTRCSSFFPKRAAVPLNTDSPDSIAMIIPVTMTNCSRELFFSHLPGNDTMEMDIATLQISAWYRMLHKKAMDLFFISYEEVVNTADINCL